MQTACPLSPRSALGDSQLANCQPGKYKASARSTIVVLDDDTENVEVPSDSHVCVKLSKVLEKSASDELGGLRVDEADSISLPAACGEVHVGLQSPYAPHHHHSSAENGSDCCESAAAIPLSLSGRQRNGAGAPRFVEASPRRPAHFVEAAPPVPSYRASEWSSREHSTSTTSHSVSSSQPSPAPSRVRRDSTALSHPLSLELSTNPPTASKAPMGRDYASSTPSASTTEERMARLQRSDSAIARAKAYRESADAAALAVAQSRGGSNSLGAAVASAATLASATAAKGEGKARGPADRLKVPAQPPVNNVRGGQEEGRVRGGVCDRDGVSGREVTSNTIAHLQAHRPVQPPPSAPRGGEVPATPRTIPSTPSAPPVPDIPPTPCGAPHAPEETTPSAENELIAMLHRVSGIVAAAKPRDVNRLHTACQMLRRMCTWCGVRAGELPESIDDVVVAACIPLEAVQKLTTVPQYTHEASTHFVESALRARRVAVRCTCLRSKVGVAVRGADAEVRFARVGVHAKPHSKLCGLRGAVGSKLHPFRLTGSASSVAKAAAASLAMCGRLIRGGVVSDLYSQLRAWQLSKHLSVMLQQHDHLRGETIKALDEATNERKRTEDEVMKVKALTTKLEEARGTVRRLKAVQLEQRKAALPFVVAQHRALVGRSIAENEVAALKAKLDALNASAEGSSGVTAEEWADLRRHCAEQERVISQLRQQVADAEEAAVAAERDAEVEKCRAAAAAAQLNSAATAWQSLNDVFGGVMERTKCTPASPLQAATLMLQRHVEGSHTPPRGQDLQAVAPLSLSSRRVGRSHVDATPPRALQLTAKDEASVDRLLDGAAALSLEATTTRRSRSLPASPSPERQAKLRDQLSTALGSLLGRQSEFINKSLTTATPIENPALPDGALLLPSRNNRLWTVTVARDNQRRGPTLDGPPQPYSDSSSSSSDSDSGR